MRARARIPSIIPSTPDGCVVASSKARVWISTRAPEAMGTFGCSVGTIWETFPMSEEPRFRFVGAPLSESPNNASARR